MAPLESKPGPPAIASKMRRELLSSNGRELLEIKSDGLYIFQYEIQADKDFTANIVIEVRRNSGYLSAVDWPLLPVSSVLRNFNFKVMLQGVDNMEV